MYKENDNLNKEEIDKFRSMSQTERDKLLAEKEKEVLKEKKNQKALCRNAGCFFDFEILNFKFRVTAEFVTSYLDIVFFAVTICAVADLRRETSVRTSYGIGAGSRLCRGPFF